MASTTRCRTTLAAAAIASLLPLASAAESSRCRDQPLRLTAVWYDVTDFFTDGGAGAAQELQRRFCEIGVHTDWRRARPGDPYGRGARLEIPVVILRCHPLQQRVPRPIMGEVPELWDAPGPRPVRVYVEGIRDALSLDRIPGSAEDLMRLAVGRVATHEMVHSLAPGQGHAVDGLMSSRMGRPALVGPPPDVAAGHVSAVRAALRIGRQRPAPVLAGRVRVAPLYGDEAPAGTDPTPR